MGTLLRSSRYLAAVVALALVIGVALPSAVAAARSPTSVATMRVLGSAFDPDGDGRRETIRIEVELAGAASVRLQVRDFDGRQVRVLADRKGLSAGSHAWTWNGRATNGRRVAHGAYKVVANVDPVTGPSVKRSRWVTRARRVPYAIAPGAIVVALDAGHGGPAAGAVWRGRHEDDINLDIAKRLEAMLKGAGIGVVMTRRSDRNVSPAGRDITGDGRYTRLDELVARNDIANIAGADVHIAIHNNASTCHCTRGTEMYTRKRRGWAPEGRRLARLVLDEHIRHLRQLPGFRPRNRGVKGYPFKALKPYSRRSMPRPSLQPSILGESLFIDVLKEHRVLTSRGGRSAIAAAYFVGIARYLDKRRYGVHYEVLAAPRKVAKGSEATVRVRVTNTGRRSSDGWRLKGRVVRAVRRYDGRPRRGRVRVASAIPDGLKPGESVEVALAGIPMRSKTGRWLIKLDIGLPNGRQLSRRGVVGPQLRVRTVKR